MVVGSRRKIHRHGLGRPPPLAVQELILTPAARSIVARAFQQVPARPTVGDETARFPLPVLFLVCSVMPCTVIGISALLACSMYTDLPDLVAGAPWRPLAILLGGVVPALVTTVVGYMHLHLPRAPWALREALVNVGLYSLGVPLWMGGTLVAVYGSTWIFAAMACLVAILAAAVIAFWLCLVCVYA